VKDLAATMARQRTRYDELSGQLGDPVLLKDQRRYRDLAREHARLKEQLALGERILQLQTRLADDREFVHQEKDPELIAMAREEIADLEEKIETLTGELEEALLPHDPNDDRDAILEIRAGTGGDEAALFAEEICRMYLRFAERRGWRVEFIDATEGASGGFKEIIYAIRGEGVFGVLRLESGVHRVQRVPVTESQGRIHTSAVSVAVLPEAEEVDLEIRPSDLRIDVFRSQGPGGQSVNTTDSAVRITHLPTGLVVKCQDEKSQHKNKAKAMQVLRSRLLERAIAEQEQAISADRRAQVGSGDRSAKIRTYNFPQSRVTDHRIGLTLHNLDAMLDGDLDEVVAALQAHRREQALAAARPAQ
jgi:peptide chain release factor 1